MTNRKEDHMAAQKRKYIHLEQSMWLLDSTAKILTDVEKASDNNPLKKHAFHYALIQYCMPYNRSDWKLEELDSTIPSVRKNYRLENKYVPDSFLVLHQKIIEYRNERLAHFDFSEPNPSMQVFLHQGQQTRIISENIIYPKVQFSDIEQILQLIRVTVQNITKELEALIDELGPNSALLDDNEN